METENKYHSSKIYKIVDNAYTKIYYGSTVQPLSKRFAGHRDKYRCGTLQATSKLIFDEFGVDNCKIELIEKVKCESKEELLKIEGEYIKNNECVNKMIAGRTKQEYNDYYKESGRQKEAKKKYREENHEIIIQKKKEYYDTNKERINQKHNDYYKANAEKIAEARKLYQLANVDKIRERKKQYAMANAEKIKEKRSQVHECECGSTYTRIHKSRHNKTIKHLDYIANKNKTIEI